MTLMGFPKKKKLDRGVGGWVELYPNYFWIFGIFLTLQSPLTQIFPIDLSDCIQIIKKLRVHKSWEFILVLIRHRRIANVTTISGMQD